MTEQEKMQYVSLGKQARDVELIIMFEKLKSPDLTDTEYSLSNVLTIAEVIRAIESNKAPARY